MDREKTKREWNGIKEENENDKQNYMKVIKIKLKNGCKKEEKKEEEEEEEEMKSKKKGENRKWNILQV